MAGQNWCSRRVKTLVFSNKHPRISLVLSSQHQGYLSPLKLRVLTIDMLSLRDLARQRIVFAGLEGTPFGQEVFLDGVSVLLSGGTPHLEHRRPSVDRSVTTRDQHQSGTYLMYSSKAEAYPNRRRRVSPSNCGDRKAAMTRYTTSVSAVSRGVEQASFFRVTMKS